MKELVKNGKYIIMSSHQMSSVEEFCTDLVILDRGKSILKGNLKEIKNSYKTSKVIVEANDNIDDIIKDLKLSVLSKDDNVYVISADDNIRQKLFKRLSDRNIEKFEVVRPSLHEIFIDKVGE